MKKQKDYQEQVNQKDYTQKLYFKGGVPQNQAFKRDHKKLLRSLVFVSSKQILSTCLEHLFFTLRQGFNVWLYIMIAISAAASAYQQLLLCVIQLSFNVTMCLLRLYQQITKAQSQLQEYFQETAYVITWEPRCHISKVPKQDVVIGNLVFLKRHQPSPVTLLVLSSQEEKFMVKSWQQDGITNRTPKQCIKLTSNSTQDFVYYKRILTGKIEFDDVDFSESQFRGFIKLQKDPKGEYLDYENIVTQSSMIMNTDWVVGIVISDDDEAVRKLWNNLFKRKATHFDRYLNKFSVIFGLLYLIQLAFCITLILRFQNIPIWEDKYDIVTSIIQSITFVNPSFILGLSEISFQWFNRLFKNQSDIKVSHSSEILNLTKVDHCIFDKTGTLANTNSLLGGVICGTKYFPSLEEKQSRKDTKQFKRIMTHAPSIARNNQNVMNLIAEEDDEEEPDDKLEQNDNKLNVENNEFDFGIGPLQQSEKLIQGSQQNLVKSRIQSQNDEALSFNQNDAIFNEEEPESKNVVFNFNPHFIKENHKLKQATSLPMSEEVSSPNRSSPSKNPGRLEKRGFKHKQSRLQQSIQQSPLGSQSEIQFLNESNMIEEKKDSDSDEERKTLHDLIREQNAQTIEFMRSLVLCQDVKTKYTKKIKRPNVTKKNIEASSAMSDLPNLNPQYFFNENWEDYQESVMQYTKNLKFEFNCAGFLNRKLVYEISVVGLSERWVVQKKLRSRDTFVIAVEKIVQAVRNREQVNQIRLFIKSEEIALLDDCKLSQAKRINLEKQLNHLQQQGYRFVVYAGKVLGSEQKEYKLFKNKDYGQQNISIETQELNEAEREVLKELDYYGCICLKDDHNSGSLQIVRTLKHLGIPQWILSSDPKMQTLSTAYQASIVQRENTLLRIDEQEEEKLKLQIKSQLLFIRKQLLKETESNQSESATSFKQFVQSKTFYDNMKRPIQKKATFDESIILMHKRGEEPLQKVCLLVDGRCLKTIFSDDYMKSHFLFIALTLRTVVAYNCSPKDKELISQSVEQILAPHGILLTISDSIDDLYMNQFAKAPVVFMNRKSLLKIAYSNIQINNLQHLKQLILYFAKLLPMHLCTITLFCTKVTLCQLIKYTLLVCIRNVLYTEENIVYMLSMQLQIIFITGFLITHDDRSHIEAIELLLPQSLPLTYKSIKSNFRWLQELFYEVIPSAVINGLICTYIFADFMVFKSFDTASHLHLMFILQTFSIIGFGISQMYHLNISITNHILNFTVSITLMTISLSMIATDDIRETIVKQVFKWQFIMGLLTQIGTILLVDQLIKQTREKLFTPRVIHDFLKHLTTILKEDPDRINNLPIKQFPIKQQMKISRQFFRKIKTVFNNVIIDPFIRSLFESEKTQSFSDEYSRFSLIFNNKNYEKQFRYNKIIYYYQHRRIIVLGIFLVLRIGSMIAYTPFTTTYDVALNSIWLFITFCWTLIVVYTKLEERKLENVEEFQNYWGNIEAYLILPLVIILDHLLSVNEPQDKKQFYFSTFGQLLYQQLLAWDIFPPPLLYPITLTALFFIQYSFRVFQFLEKIEADPEIITFRVEFVSLYLLLFLLCFLSTYTHYNFQRFQRLVFLFDQALQTQQEQTNQILKSLLPAFIYDKIEADSTQIEENQGSVAIVFLEICEFDKILQSKQRQVVTYLDDIFRVLDKLCIQYGVQKIETVGKTYMACSGLKSSQIENNKDGLHQGKKNETTIALDLAFEFFNAMAEFQQEFKDSDGHVTYKNLKIKIGIHYGQVIAGVIGYHKPQFSLIGDTVNTASRMCSTGQIDRITISDEAYSRVNDTQYLFTSRKVEAKGKGWLTVYQVSQRRLGGRKVTYPMFKGEQVPITIDFQQYVNLKKQTLVNQPMTQSSRRGTQMRGSQHNSSGTQKEPTKQTRRSRIQNSMQQSQVIFLKAKKGFQNGEKTGRKITQKGYTSMSEEVNRQRPKSLIVQKSEFFQEAWEDNKADEIQIKPIDWYPEQRMMGTSEDLELQEIKQERKDTLQRKKQSQPHQQYLSLRFQQWTLEYNNVCLNDPEVINQFEQYYLEVRSALKDIFYPLTITYTLAKTQIQLFDEGSDGQITYIVRMFLVLYLLILYTITSRLKKYKMPVLDLALTGLYYVSGLLTIFFITFDGNSRFLISDKAEAYLFAFSAVNQQSLKFKYMFFYIMIPQIAWFVQLLVYEHSNLLAFIVLSTIVLIIVSHNNFSLTIQNFNSAAKENLKKEQRDSLLTNLLPAHILTRFYQNNKIKLELSDVLIDATLLFADISGFTAYSSSVSAEQVVKMLRKLMTAFDKECLQWNVYKVYTIGDCYVVLGINDMEQRHPGQEAKNVLEMGLQMVEIIKSVRKEINFKDLNMRIGIHTGQFYGGIIGTDIVRYDIFGVDAVIANKMESHGLPAQVMVSEDTMRLINNHFPKEYTFTLHKEVEIPVAKKKVKGYLTQKNREESQYSAQFQYN